MFGRYLHARGVPNEAVDAVATSAIRDADNGADLLALAQERTGLSISVLSAEEEARLGYVAAVNSTTLTDGVVLDLGGGSLQLTQVAGRQAGGVGLVAARRGAGDRAAPPRLARRHAQAAQGGARRGARAARRRAVARGRRRPARRHGRRRPQPRGRRPGRQRPDPGLGARARRARRAGGRARQAPGLPPRAAGHQGEPRRHRPRRRRGAGDRARARRLRRHRGHPRRPARGRVLQPAAAARLGAAAGRRPRRLDPQPRAAVRRRHRPRRPRRAARAAAPRLAGRGGRDRAGAAASASCCGRPRCCTTSGCRSATTPTPSTRTT